MEGLNPYKVHTVCVCVLPIQGDADDGENPGDSTSPPKGRRKIRRILEVQQLAKETQEALREEEERRKRLAERDRQRRQEKQEADGEQGRDDAEVRLPCSVLPSAPLPCLCGRMRRTV